MSLTSQRNNEARFTLRRFLHLKWSDLGDLSRQSSSIQGVGVQDLSPPPNPLFFCFFFFPSWDFGVIIFEVSRPRASKGARPLWPEEEFASLKVTGVKQSRRYDVQWYLTVHRKCVAGLFDINRSEERKPPRLNGGKEREREMSPTESHKSERGYSTDEFHSVWELVSQSGSSCETQIY